MEQNSLQVKKSRYVIGGASEKEDLGIGWWERKDFTHTENDTFIVITGKHVGRPDLIAYDFLGDTRLWWLIAQYNHIIDPYDEFQEGKYIRIPPMNMVNSLTGKVGGIQSQREIATSFIQPIV